MSTGIMIVEIHTHDEDQLDAVYALIATHRDVIHTKRLEVD